MKPFVVILTVSRVVTAARRVAVMTDTGVQLVGPALDVQRWVDTEVLTGQLKAIVGELLQIC